LIRVFPKKARFLMVTHVGKTWHSLLVGLEQIDAAFDELVLDEEQ